MMQEPWSGAEQIWLLNKLGLSGLQY